MGQSIGPIWVPDESDKGKPHVYLATMAASINTGISDKIAPLEFDSGFHNVPVLDPFELYGATQPITIRRIGKLVTVNGGVKWKSTPSSSSGVAFEVPAGFRPSTYNYAGMNFVQQASGSDRWDLRIGWYNPRWTATVERYGPGTWSATTWLPFTAMWFTTDPISDITTTALA